MAILDSHLILLDHVSSGYEAQVHVVQRLLASCKTKYQTIELVQTPAYGKILILDGRVQSAQLDEYIYHEALVQPAMVLCPKPRKILIIGGGEGATLREALKHPDVEKVTMVDLDEELVEFCKKHLPEWHSGSFFDSKAEIIAEDGRQFIEKTKQRYDVIIIDLPEPLAGGPAFKLYTKEFYALVASRLNKHGIVAVQSDAPVEHSAHIWLTIYKTVSSTFSWTLPYMINVSSFGSPWAFTLACEEPITDLYPEFIDRIISVRGLNQKLRLFDGITFLHMISLPAPLRRLLSKQIDIFTDDSPPQTYKFLSPYHKTRIDRVFCFVLLLWSCVGKVSFDLNFVRLCVGHFATS